MNCNIEKQSSASRKGAIFLYIATFHVLSLSLFHKEHTEPLIILKGIITARISELFRQSSKAMYIVCYVYVKQKKMIQQPIFNVKQENDTA